MAIDDAISVTDYSNLVNKLNNLRARHSLGQVSLSVPKNATALSSAMRTLEANIESTRASAPFIRQNYPGRFSMSNINPGNQIVYSSYSTADSTLNTYNSICVYYANYSQYGTNGHNDSSYCDSNYVD